MPDSQICAQCIQIAETLRDNATDVLAPSVNCEGTKTASYPASGDNVVTKPAYKSNCVYINETQYFDNVPENAWKFYIGGYQPAQKWLKDRSGRTLDYDDIIHYQKIIAALLETERIMIEIDYPAKIQAHA